MQKILEGLNEKQKEAVLAPDGPVLVIAGAGSGKTKALTHRVAYLMARGVPAREILAVTFTNKAADEMKERITALIGRAEIPFIGTFHSFAMRILREEAKSIGFTPRFSIFDEDDSLALIKEVMLALDISTKQYPAGTIQTIVSSLKNELITPENYGAEPGAFARAVARVYAEYQKRLREANAMDFDDLLMHLVLLLEREPRVLETYQDRYRHLLIDEYQDTNHAQYRLIKLLAAKYRDIFAIGDDAQSIYSWRGANFANILSFERDWPEAKVVVLDQNYRSTQTILDAAHGVISQNTLQKEKKLWTENPPGEPIMLVPLPTERYEAEFIAAAIEQHLAEGYRPEDFAVLYRTNAQSRVIEESLIRRNLPYRIIGGVKFYQRKEIKDLIAYLRILENDRDIVSLKRIANVPPRGIGKVALLKLLANDFSAAPSGGAAGSGDAMNARERETANKFIALMAELKNAKSSLRPSAFITRLVKTIRFQEYLADASKNAEERWENVKEFISLAKRYDGIEGGEAYAKLLEDIALIENAGGREEKQAAIRLLTLHAAKGLEFRAVFIAGLEEGIFPHSRAQASPAEMEEERRLCYVGITRAKEKLYLLWTARRLIYGSLQANPPSRFIGELPESLAVIHPTARRYDLFANNADPADLVDGDFDDF